MIDTNLKDKVVVVTGANNPCGIGAAIAKAFATEGAQVFITYFQQSPEEYGGISTEEALEATEPGLPFYYAMQTRSADDVVQAIHDQGGQAVAWEADLGDPSSIHQVFDRAETAFGPVDVLINNAAYDKFPETIFTTDAESIDKHFAVNTRAVVLMIAEFVRRYKKREVKWGRIVNLSTDAAQRFAGSISYGASKAATEALTRSVAIEVGPLGITVNTVAPGPVQTGSYSKESVNKQCAEIPLGRIGKPEDIADAIIFLASDQARWLTGQVIKVSGGHAI